MSYAPIPRAAAERLKELLAARDRADIEAAGILAGLAWGLGIELDQIVNVDDGDNPALILRDDIPLDDPDLPEIRTEEPPPRVLEPRGTEHSAT